jgi:lysyl-tRNA synthetase, class I
MLKIDVDKALSANAWPFKEAKEILKRIGNKTPDKGYVLFETGYGPSGLPHIGTFGEVLRTTIVRKAFEAICDIPTKLFCVSDDMDGMRKIPDTVPNKDEYMKYIDFPLTKIPDPFKTDASYAHNMNAKLRAFLDGFGFEYKFFSATDCYVNGTFNDALMKVIDSYEKIMDIMLPTLGLDRQKTYSPFLPVDPESGKVLQVPIELDKKQKTITYKNPNGNVITSEVTNGKCKLQWKPDFGMRWYAFDVDFEMYGKDHLVNGPIYTAICRALGGKAPHQMFYELFLDERGEKISKSKGNGLTIDKWLRYAPRESLSYFMYQSPKKAKKLHFDVIPKCVDEYLQFAKSFPSQDEIKQLENPVFHIHEGTPPHIDIDFSFSLLLNLVSACGNEDKNLILGYIKKEKLDFDTDSALATQLVLKAINYYHDFVKPNKKFRNPTPEENRLLLILIDELSALNKNSTAEEIQNKVYEIGRNSGTDLKLWFASLYQILLGTDQGPRFGSFVSLYGLNETIDLVKSKCIN